MTTISKTIVFVALFAVASLANAAGFTVFDNIEACKNAAVASRAQVYNPTTKAPFQGGNGWTQKTVTAGGACLGEAHVLEDGAPKNGKAVFVAEGFVYWEHTSGAFRMNDCSNPFGSIVFIKSTEPTTRPAHTALAANTVTNVTNITNVKEVVNVTQICTINGKQVPLTDGQCSAPEIVVALPVKVEPTTQASCGTLCTPKPVAQVLGERTARVCGIEVLTSPTDKTVIGRLQLDEDPANPGKIRIARVEAFEGRATLVSVSSLPHSGNKDCNVDQATVYKYWPQVLKKFQLPDVCVPQMVRKTT